MREIKFRCWAESENRMLYENERASLRFHENADICTMPNNPDNQFWTTNPLLPEHIKMEVLQFSGLLDKNGVEIYEGDIVEFHYNCYVNGDKTRIERKMLVEWNDCGFYITDDSGRILIKTMISLSFIGFGDPSIEVVGNRFQHPELLNAK